MKKKILCVIMLATLCLVGCSESNKKDSEVLISERESYSEIVQAYDELLDEAKDPYSVKVEECIVNHMTINEEKIDTYYTYILFKGKNGFGNEIEECFKFTHDHKFESKISETVQYNDYKMVKDKASGQCEEEWERVSDTHHKHEFESIAYKGKVQEEVFIIDWEDFENEMNINK